MNRVTIATVCYCKDIDMMIGGENCYIKKLFSQFDYNFCERLLIINEKSNDKYLEMVEKS